METNVRAIVQGLNDEQRKAVQCTEGPVLIVAGAGSGKTRVLTSRIAYILAGGIDASRVMALTFTKKAAGEMKERIAMMVGERNARHLVMGTFHSVFVRFLREYADLVGYPAAFTIYDASDQLSAMKTCVKELQLDDKIYKPKDVLSRISMAKNNLVTVQAYKANPTIIKQDQYSKRPRIADLYELYQKKLKESGVMDFDDILVNMNILLRDNPQALQQISDRFSYILVDEYQDTNFSQYVILKRLAATHRNLCVVGDDSQSIYAFRGAKIENILNFKKDYPECKLFRLERNYRSTSTIVEAANSLIAHNEGRIPKKCYSEEETGEKIRIIRSFTEAEEAALLVSEIRDRMRTEHAAYSDFAMLYRTNSQSRALEEALRRSNIPYMIYSGNSFFERAEIKDMMAYFKLVVNPHDDEAFKRAVNKPARGIGDTTLKAVADIARQQETSLFKAALQLPRTQSFCQMIDSLAQLVTVLDAYALAQKIYDASGLYAFHKADTSVEGMARAANLDELLNSIATYVEEQREREDEVEDSLPDFLQNIALLSNVDVTEEEDSSNKVALMTVHSAKGLEFPYVMVAGLEENLFPNTGMLSSSKDLEEERRLFYVAITRAKKALALSFASTRMRNGQHESNRPSRFISEIDPRFIDNPLDMSEKEESRAEVFRGGFTPRPSFGKYNYGQSSAVRYEHPGSRQAWKQPAPSTAAVRPSKPSQMPKPDLIDKDFQAVPMTELFEGERIEHNRFGAGIIKEITGTVPELKARVAFDDYGEKILLLKYAKLRPLK